MKNSLIKSGGMKSWGKRSLWLLGAACCWLGVHGQVKAADANSQAEVRAGEIKNKAELARQKIEKEYFTVGEEARKDELAMNEFIVNAVKSAREQNVGGGFLDEVKFVDVSLREIALRVMEQGLASKRAKISKQVSEQLVEQAKSVFDPVFMVSGTYYSTVSRDRRTKTLQYRRGTELDGGEHRVYFSSPPIRYTVFDQERPEGYYMKTTWASKATPGGPKEQTTMSMNMQQILPWGMMVSIGVDAYGKEATFQVNEAFTATQDYNRPWTMGMRFNFSAPLPYTRTFGPNNRNDLSPKVAQLGNEIASLDAMAIVNSALFVANSAYWDLVGSIHKLGAAIRARELSEELVAGTKRRYDERLIREDNMAQIEAGHEQIRAAEVAAFQTYISASNRLYQLLNLDDPVALLPLDYLVMLDKEPLAFNDADLTLENPEILKIAASVKRASIGMAASEIEVRPDVRLTTSVNMKQDNSVYGYHTLGDAAGRLMAPDRVQYDVSLGYSGQIGNRAAEANLDRDRHELERQGILGEKVRSELKRDFTDALGLLNSSREQVEINRRNDRLARSVYDRAVRFAGERRKSEYEVVQKLLDRLNANNAFIQSQVDLKKSEAKLLASMGVLPKLLGERTAQTDFDMARVTFLIENGILDLKSSSRSGGNERKN